MKIELCTADSSMYVIRSGTQYFQCFAAGNAWWISTPYLARHFGKKEDAESAVLQINRQRSGGTPCRIA